jgi:hypothetical protein
MTRLLKRDRPELNRHTRKLRIITAIIRMTHMTDVLINAMKISLFSASVAVEKDDLPQLFRDVSSASVISQRSPLKFSAQLYKTFVKNYCQRKINFFKLPATNFVVDKKAMSFIEAIADTQSGLHFGNWSNIELLRRII